MSSMDDQGHLPPDVEPGRRTGPEAKDVPVEGRPQEERLHDDEELENAGRESPAEPPFEPGREGGRAETGHR